MSAANPKVVLDVAYTHNGQATTGRIVLELDAQKAPKSVENFLDYVNRGHYINTIFHRVIPGFMIQGGGFAPGMTQKPTVAPIQNEAANGLKNVTYSVAMARTSDPHSATAQFFINVADNRFLDHTAPSAQGWGYAVFGKVIEGTEHVDAIKATKTGRKGFHDDVPKEDVTITNATVVDEQEITETVSPTAQQIVDAQAAIDARDGSRVTEAGSRRIVERIAERDAAAKDAQA